MLEQRRKDGLELLNVEQAIAVQIKHLERDVEIVKRDCREGTESVCSEKLETPQQDRHDTVPACRVDRVKRGL